MDSEQTGRQAARFSFARHETFYLRDGWLYKGLSALQIDGAALNQQDAHHKLGLGTNMLRSLVYWLRAANLVQPNRALGNPKRTLELTPLAELVLAEDKYFEDTRTLWLLHTELCNNRELATFFYWVFNECPQREFTEQRLARGAACYVDENGGKQVAETSLLKDARCFVHTYAASDEHSRTHDYDTIECPLASLGLVRKGALPGYYRLNVGSHRGLSSRLFLYALYRFRDLSRPGELVLSLDDIKWAPHSPGRIFCLDMHSIVECIEEIQHSTSHLRFTRTADLNMVSLESSTQTEDLLHDCYFDRG